MSLSRVLTPPSPFWADLQSPLADRLALLWCADGNYDVISRTFGVLSGSSPPVPGISDVGKVFIFPGGAAAVSYIDLGVQAVHANIAQGQPFTVFWIGSPTTSGAVAVHSDNNGSQGFMAGVTTPTQHGVVLVRASTNGSSAGNFTLSAATSAPSQAFMVSSDGQGTTNSGQTYADSRPLSTTTAVGAGAQNSDVTQHMCIGGNNTGGALNSCFTGGIKLVAIWRRVLTPAEALALQLDPMLLYRNSHRRRNRVAGLAIGAGVVTARPSVFVCT